MDKISRGSAVGDSFANRTAVLAEQRSSACAEQRAGRRACSLQHNWTIGEQVVAAAPVKQTPRAYRESEKWWEFAPPVRQAPVQRADREIGCLPTGASARSTHRNEPC